jgi:hypothetical protein
MKDKLAEEILFRYRLKSSGMTEKDMIEAMQAYHNAKMKEVTDEDDLDMGDLGWPYDGSDDGER